MLKPVSNDLKYELECYEIDKPIVPHSLLPLEMEVLAELVTGEI